MSDQLLAALEDCVSVMDRELNGLAVIQPELKAARAALAEHQRMPAPWTGEGLPPVGEVCEHQIFGCDGWSEAAVLAYGKKKTFYRDRDGNEWSRLSDEIKFRPIRAVKQIDGDEVEKDAQALFGFVNPNGKWWKADTEYKDRFRNAVRAGYRKQVAP